METVYTAEALATGAGRNGRARTTDGRVDLALAVAADAHAGPHAGVAELDLLLAGDGLHGGVEARGVARREQLLGVGAVAAAAHLLRDGEVEVESALARGDAAVSSGSGGECFGGVESVHRVDSFRVGVSRRAAGVR